MVSRFLVTTLIRSDFAEPRISHTVRQAPVWGEGVVLRFLGSWGAMSVYRQVVCVSCDEHDIDARRVGVR